MLPGEHVATTSSRLGSETPLFWDRGASRSPQHTRKEHIEICSRQSKHRTAKPGSKRAPAGSEHPKCTGLEGASWSKHSALLPPQPPGVVPLLTHTPHLEPPGTLRVPGLRCCNSHPITSFCFDFKLAGAPRLRASEPGLLKGG